MTLTNRLTLYLWIRQTQNFQDLGFKWTTRKYIMLSVRKVLLELDIRYYPPVQKVEMQRPVADSSLFGPAHGHHDFATDVASGGTL